MLPSQRTPLAKKSLMTRLSLPALMTLPSVILLTLFISSASFVSSPRNVEANVANNPLTSPTSAPSNPMTGTTTLTDICSQHPNICPVNQHTWSGEQNAWRYTGKKWQRLSSTPGDIEIMWFWSAPYLGTNPAYATHREVHYDDFSNTPDGFPIFTRTLGITDTPPIVYEWQTWIQAGNSYRLYQYGGNSEQASHKIGESDCDSGIYYPMTDHTLDYAYTPMSVLLGSPAECVDRGYMSAHQVEQWGKPLSPERISRCDDPLIGVPTSESSKGNAICKLSPYVGIIYQRYAWGSTATTPPHVGCEGVVYTWGWPKPQQVNDGQDYQAWFRNGELRFSKWIYLSDQLPISGQIPAPDDHAWWDTECGQQAWTETTNWIYSGVYRIGSTIYTDTLSAIVATTVPTAGDELVAEIDSTSYIFLANTFTDTVIVTHTFRSAAQAPPTGNLLGINHFYQANAVYSDTRQPAQITPGQSYSVTIQYADTDIGAAIENSLKLYYWDNERWSPQGITSTVDITRNILSAQADHLSLFAVLGETRRIYLPLVRR